MGGKIFAPKICAKTRFEHFVCLEDGSQKKKAKKICAKLAQNPSPNNADKVQQTQAHADVETKANATNAYISLHPSLQSRGPQIPIFKGFWDLCTENWGAPKTPNSDLIPHLRPSGLLI